MVLAVLGAGGEQQSWPSAGQAVEALPAGMAGVQGLTAGHSLPADAPEQPAAPATGTSRWRDTTLRPNPTKSCH